MNEHSNEVASMYKEFARSSVFKHLEQYIKQEVDDTRRNASKSQDTAYGDLRFADGKESVLDFIKSQQVRDKI